jgi:predicted CopG family antitoxin
MSFKGVSLSVVAYERLKNAKREGESFSEAIIRLCPPRPRSFVGAGKDLVLKGSKLKDLPSLHQEFKQT